MKGLLLPGVISTLTKFLSAGVTVLINSNNYADFIKALYLHNKLTQEQLSRITIFDRAANEGLSDTSDRDKNKVRRIELEAKKAPGKKFFVFDDSEPGKFDWTDDHYYEYIKVTARAVTVQSSPAHPALRGSVVIEITGRDSEPAPFMLSYELSLGDDGASTGGVTVDMPASFASRKRKASRHGFFETTSTADGSVTTPSSGSTRDPKPPPTRAPGKGGGCCTIS